MKLAQILDVEGGNFGRLWMGRKKREREKKQDRHSIIRVKSSSVFVRRNFAQFCIWRERAFLPRGFLSTWNVDVIEGGRGKLMALTVWEARKGIYRSFECTSRAETSSIFQRRGREKRKKKSKKGTESNGETRSLGREKDRVIKWCVIKHVVCETKRFTI